MRYYERVMSLGLPFVAVSLEELTHNPATKLARVCELIGMPYFDGKERFWEKEHHHLFGSLGVCKAMEHPETMEIRPDSDCPEGFEEKAQAALEASGKLEHVRSMQQYLQEHEVDRVESYPTNALKKHTIKPLWYYRSWLSSAWKSRFPQQWPHDQ